MTEHDKSQSSTAKPKSNPKPARGLDAIASVQAAVARSLVEGDDREAKKKAKKMIDRVANIASNHLLEASGQDFDEAATLAENALDKARAVNLLEIRPSEMQELLFNVLWGQVAAGSHKPECRDAMKKAHDRLGRSLTVKETLKVLQKTIPSAFVVRFA